MVEADEVCSRKDAKAPDGPRTTAAPFKVKQWSNLAGFS
jgi:hypothetical protein